MASNKRTPAPRTPDPAANTPKPKPWTISLKRRDAEVTHWNFSPEKSGPDELVPRGDLAVSFVAKAEEIATLVRVRKGDVGSLLWDVDGEPQLLDVTKSIEVRIRCEGKLELVARGGRTPLKFDAVMKKVSIVPFLGRAATVRCQFRIDPTGHAEALHAIDTERACALQFSGKARPAKIDGDDLAQGELDV